MAGVMCQQAGGSTPTLCRPPRGRRRCLAVRANLLDLLRGGGGGGSSSLEPDAQGEALKQWMMERGLPPQKVRPAECRFMLVRLPQPGSAVLSLLPQFTDSELPNSV